MKHMPRIHIQLSDAQYEWLEINSDSLRTKSAIIRHLIDSEIAGLDTLSRIPVYRVGAGEKVLTQPEKLIEVQTSIPSSKNSSNLNCSLGDSVGRESEGTPRKPPFNKVIPDNLKPFEKRILDFWKIKKGSKSSQAWSLQMTQLGKILDDLGKDILIDQLDSACLSGTWKAIDYKRTVQFLDIQKKNKPEPEPKHPAYKVFKADDFDSPGKTTNELLGGLI